MTAFRRTAAAALAGLGAAACLLFPSGAAAAAVPAQMSDSVVESIGVNTHLGYSDTPYNEFEKVRNSLRELGIRYIRDGVFLNRPEVYSRFRQLAAEGIHLDAIAGDPQHRWGTGTPAQELNTIESELTSAVVSIEGPNEYDLSGSANWASELREYTRELAEGARSRPKLASVPLVAPSIVIRENEESIGDLTPWIDYGNTHTYMGGEIPETNKWNEDLAAVSHFAGSKPVQATETGYQNALNTTNGHLPTSERATATYMPRLFLENFRRGITRSYAYELIDEHSDPTLTDIESAFGLLHNDFTMKPAAVALKNLISLLSDKGASFTPGSLDYTVEGAPSTLRQVLLEKRDGSFYLAVWNRVSVWDRFHRVDLEPANVPVTVRFGQRVASAEVFEPNQSGSALSSSANPSSLSLSLSPKVQIIRVVPATETTTPATEATPPTTEATPPAAEETTPAPESPASEEPAPEPSPTVGSAPSGEPAPEASSSETSGTETTPAPAPESSPKHAKRPAHKSRRKARGRAGAQVSRAKGRCAAKRVHGKCLLRASSRATGKRRA